MIKTVKFTKMHGAGNDYIYVDTLLYSIPDPSAAAIKWSAPHTGIGSDGLVLIGKPSITSGADFSMRIFNADGSEAMMCGNASRCIGKYLYERKLTDKTEIKLETLSGVKTLRLHLATGGTVESVTVDMLEPRLHVPEQYDESCLGELSASFRKFRGTFVSMGNPHFVTFVDDIDTIDIARYGARCSLSPTLQHRVCTGHARRHHTHKGVGTWKRNNDGVRNRCLRHGCGSTDHRTCSEQKHNKDGWRHAAHRMERRRWTCLHDGASRICV